MAWSGTGFLFRQGLPLDLYFMNFYMNDGRSFDGPFHEGRPESRY